MTKPTCEIRICTTTGNYYISRGCLRSMKDWRTFKGAVRAATKKGFEVLTKVDPMIEFRANEKRTKIVTNMMSGKLVRIPVNTPNYCDPSSEAYWSK